MKLTRVLSRWSLCALIALLALPGCKHKPEGGPQILPPNLDYEKELPPGKLALVKITDEKMIPDFTSACADLAGLRQSIAHSLDYLAKPSSKKHFPYGDITHDQAVASLTAMTALIDRNPSPADMNAQLRKDFDVYISVGCDNKGTVLFTGYYTPILEASLTRTDRFRYPLYKMPANVTKNEEGAISDRADRKTIETTQRYAGQELCWLADPFEAYVAHVQGSARLRLAGGREMTVGYTANNGYEYVSIRSELIAAGKIGKRDGLAAMIAYFKSHPNEVFSYTHRNPRFIFFTIIEDGQPRGCLNEPVTTFRSIATDKRKGMLYPPACLAFLSMKASAIADGPPLHTGFACDQDTGGAIRAAGRCDLYVGVGPGAGELAGRTMNEGKLYYLFLKPGVPAPVLQPTVPTPPVVPPSK